MPDDASTRSPGWHGTTILWCGMATSPSPATARSAWARPSSRATPARSAGSAGGDVLAGFAGATADAFTLLERLEAKLERYPGQLERACVELAKDWRTDRYLRRLEAMLSVADKSAASPSPATATCWSRRTAWLGDGDRLRRQLRAGRRPGADADGAPAEEIARRAMEIAADICVYTNANVIVESL